MGVGAGGLPILKRKANWACVKEEGNETVFIARMGTNKCGRFV